MNSTRSSSTSGPLFTLAWNCKAIGIPASCPKGSWNATLWHYPQPFHFVQTTLPLICIYPHASESLKALRSRFFFLNPDLVLDHVLLSAQSSHYSIYKAVYIHPVYMRVETKQVAVSSLPSAQRKDKYPERKHSQFNFAFNRKPHSLQASSSNPHRQKRNQGIYFISLLLLLLISTNWRMIKSLRRNTDFPHRWIKTHTFPNLTPNFSQKYSSCILRSTTSTSLGPPKTCLR